MKRQNQERGEGVRCEKRDWPIWRNRGIHEEDQEGGKEGREVYEGERQGRGRGGSGAGKEGQEEDQTGRGRVGGVGAALVPSLQ